MKTRTKMLLGLTIEGVVSYTALIFVLLLIMHPDQMSDDSWIPKDRLKNTISIINKINPL